MFLWRFYFWCISRELYRALLYTHSNAHIHFIFFRWSWSSGPVLIACWNAWKRSFYDNQSSCSRSTVFTVYIGKRFSSSSTVTRQKYCRAFLHDPCSWLRCPMLSQHLPTLSLCQQSSRYFLFPSFCTVFVILIIFRTWKQFSDLLFLFCFSILIVLVSIANMLPHIVAGASSFSLMTLKGVILLRFQIFLLHGTFRLLSTNTSLKDSQRSDTPFSPWTCP